MPAINRDRRGEYILLALKILEEKGGESPSSELIDEMEKRLDLSEKEKSLNKSGQRRWITQFRFASIGLVKAGWINKRRRIWYLTERGKDFQKYSSSEILDIMDDEYQDWASNREDVDLKNVETIDEPELLMEVEPGDILFKKLIDGVAEGKIQIPPFQRSFVWESKDIKDLLDSIYRGYPIGSFIFWITRKKLPRSRSIGNIELEKKEFLSGTEISYVIDGQQRITSLFAAIKGAEISGNTLSFLFDLRSKRFIVSSRASKADQSTIENDINNLQITIENIFIESRAEYNALARKYPDEYAEILDNLHGRFSGYRFPVIKVIDQEEVTADEDSEAIKQVVDMFSRINEKGKKLTVVAKMVARCWGEGFDLSESFENFYSQNKELENIREQTLLQAVSSVLNHKKSRSKDILNTNISKLESEWDEIIKSFLIAVEFVKTKLRVKNLTYLPFDAILVPLTYLFHRNKMLDNETTQVVEKWFWKVCLSNRYDSTVESKLEEDCDAFDEVLKGEVPEFNFLIDWEQLENNLIAQRYNLRNAFVKTVLSLYSYAEPKDLTDGREVKFEGLFSGYYKHNLHHIFPQAYLRKNHAESVDNFDSIVNIMLIPAITNLDILDKAPSVYFNDLKSKNENLDEILQHHYIGSLADSGLLENDFNKFLLYRARQIVTAFRARTGLASKSEVSFINDPSKPINILEARIRSFIHEKLKEFFEESYWDESVPTDIQEVVNKKIKDVIKRHPYGLEEYDRDDVRIQFLDIMDYFKIIVSNWNIFESIFGSKPETEKHFIALKHYRNAIKHSRSLNEVDRRNGEAAVLWFESVLR